MGYRIRTSESKFKIIEVDDGEVRDIFESEDETKIRNIHKVLNSGGCFNGLFPDFFFHRLELVDV